MTVEALRRRGEAMCRELGLESYRTGAGLSAVSHFAEIFDRYPDLADDRAVEAARGHRELFEWVVENRVGRAVAALDDRLHAWEARARITLPGGESLPYQRAAIETANEADRARRLAIDGARRAVLAEPAAMRRERLTLERELLAGLGLGDPVTARSGLSGVDLRALGASCADFLASTEDLYRAVLAEETRRELGLAPEDADRTDAAFLFREAGYDEYFPAGALLEIARRQLAEMDLDADAQGRIRYDTGDRERKRSRAFCSPARVPDEVYLVIRPFGGQTDYRAFWHELGHAQHFANVSPDLPFEHRWLGDNSVTEAFAMLFEHMVVEPTWLRRYAGLEGERQRRFRRSQAFALLAILRRYAAKLRYELALHAAPTVTEGARHYAPMLSAATGFRYPAEDALLDLDDAFYAARYLRAWQLEAMLAGSLRERFGDDWFVDPRAGGWLRGLFALGQRDDAARLAATTLGRELDFGPLVTRVAAALT